MLGERWAKDFDETISRTLESAGDLAGAVAGYSRFALEALRLQAKFELDRAYAHRTYAQVAATVYANDDYMNTCYLPGLLLSHYLWPHHYRQLRYFDDAFVKEVSRVGPALYYEIGVGTGIYSRRILGGAPEISGVAIDISSASASFAERHIQAFGASDRFEVQVRDIVRDPPEPVNYLVCVEVLEHLEDPVEFLRVLRTILRPPGRAFIATALNAANADHIYLYRAPDEVAAQLTACGFVIEQYAVASAVVPRRPGIPVPEVVAFVVT